MELWGRMQNVMESSGVHESLVQLEENMKIEATSFAERMYHYVDDSVGRMEKTLAVY